MKFYTYILKNNKGKVYIGQTNNLKRRIEEHNEIGFGYTSKHRPWILIYKEEFCTRKDAMNRERFLKSGIGRDWIKNNLLSTPSSVG